MRHVKYVQKLQQSSNLNCKKVYHNIRNYAFSLNESLGFTQAKKEKSNEISNKIDNKY